ncbi:MAG TPA: hypothetical protein VL988_06190 [Solirubrobacteraceae bacterium]|nr:hypothetical protein [Solirubrobacteraceae bacterium]
MTRTKRTPRRLLPAALAAALLAVGLASGCGTGRPAPITSGELAEAETFPYFRLYWVGRAFMGYPLAAADGQKGYLPSQGDSVYYGDCVHRKGILGGGSCILPLQVTSVIYRLHSNSALGRQRNILVRGVPATVYDDGRSIELYTGRVAVDLFSDTFAHAYRATQLLLPLNAPGTTGSELPPPVYCPGLSGPQGPALKQAMESLPGHACQKASAALQAAADLQG